MDEYSSMLLQAQQTTALIFTIIGIILLLFCSAFFSATETAFTSMNAIRMKNNAENKVKGARKALYISEHYERALTTILVGNNFVNILSTTLCAYLFGKYITNPTVANLLNTVAMTIIILIIGEILPKAYAKANSEKFAMATSGILYYLMKIIYPIVIPFYGLQMLSTRKTREKNNTPSVTEDELESIIDTMEEEGVLEKNDADLIQGTLKIREVEARDIMTHRVDVIFVEDNATNEEIEKLFVEHKYSRMPVYSNTTDNIIGILNQKDYFYNIIETKNQTLTEILTPATFVSKSTNVNSIMEIMKKEKKHMVIVVDDQGGTSGIVTMEDCLETIVGEIFDESDDEEDGAPVIEKVKDNEYKIDADVTVEELWNHLEIERTPEDKYVSIASFLIELYEGLPKVGTKIVYDTFDETIDDGGNFIEKKIRMTFAVTKMDGHRIRKLSLKLEQIQDEENKSE